MIVEIVWKYETKSKMKMNIYELSHRFYSMFKIDYKIGFYEYN